MHYKKYLKKQKQNKKKKKKKRKKKNKHRLDHKYVVFFFGFQFLYVFKSTKYIFYLKRKSWKAFGKQNIFPFLDTVYGVTGILQKHAKSKQLLKGMRGPFRRLQVLTLTER